ncbi:hypothetical protein F2P81_019435 [Scophthalmus maximus]|uniref:Uncharacterized protein n=1 Tax=Scophthalmus maximus TaxID=52904 RepID=A0A6A4S7Z3_SCOMX|nr:hypothetical protein F2P81_019435 [Scophthalmus maximus]
MSQCSINPSKLIRGERASERRPPQVSSQVTADGSGVLSQRLETVVTNYRHISYKTLFAALIPSRKNFNPPKSANGVSEVTTAMDVTVRRANIFSYFQRNFLEDAIARDAQHLNRLLDKDHSGHEQEMI